MRGALTFFFDANFLDSWRRWIIAFGLAGAGALGACTAVKDYDEPPPTVKDSPAGSPRRAGGKAASKAAQHGPKKAEPATGAAGADPSPASKTKGSGSATAANPKVPKATSSSKPPKSSDAQPIKSAPTSEPSTASSPQAAPTPQVAVIEPKGEPSAAELGRDVYAKKCAACHGDNPHNAGTLGPDIWGSSAALLEAKVLKGRYPRGYKPKRRSRAMLPLPEVKDDLKNLHAFLNQPP